MTDEVKAAEVAEEVHIDPMEKAKAGGFVEPEPPSHDDRVAALVRDVAHAMHHNAPVSLASFAELRDLLGVKDEAAAEAEGDPAAD